MNSDPKTYTVRWREISYHEATLSSEQIATMLGCTPEQVEQDIDKAIAGSDSKLADELGGYSDQGFVELTRVDIGIEELPAR